MRGSPLPVPMRARRRPARDSGSEVRYISPPSLSLPPPSTSTLYTDPPVNRAPHTPPPAPLDGTRAGLSPEVRAGLDSAGIGEPTAVQRAAVPAITSGGDVFLAAETGSGKTFAYLAPLFRCAPPVHPPTRRRCSRPHELARCSRRRPSALPYRRLRALPPRPRVPVHAVRAVVRGPLVRVVASAACSGTRRPRGTFRSPIDRGWW